MKPLNELERNIQVTRNRAARTEHKRQVEEQRKKWEQNPNEHTHPRDFTPDVELITAAALEAEELYLTLRSFLTKQMRMRHDSVVDEVFSEHAHEKAVEETDLRFDKRERANLEAKVS